MCNGNDHTNHSHRYSGITTRNDGHTHGYSGNVGGVIPMAGGHIQ